MNLGDLAPQDLTRRLRGPGVMLRTGPFVSRIWTDMPIMERGLSLLYADYPVEDDRGFADFHVSVMRPRSLRRWFQPQAQLLYDHQALFEPLPLDQALPMFEWGMNWAVGTMANQFLILHAATLERNGRVVIMPAPPGSGKSTLCAGLACRGWRLMSDEMALITLDDGLVVPLARPVSLKNKSIEVMTRFAPDAVFSEPAEETHKGTVALMRAPRDSVARKRDPARPAWIVFPNYLPGAETSLAPRSKAATFMEMGENAFNYSVHGRRGFDVLAGILDSCACYDFRYSDLDHAVQVFSSLASEA
ncbi:MAG: HprK-related kinase A [Hyphomicrobiales bacterium]|nr:HprK-related kinase A [Hyphomicrobiales bacterium]